MKNILNNTKIIDPLINNHDQTKNRQFNIIFVYQNYILNS